MSKNIIVDLSNLPKYNNKISWKDSKGKLIPFIYNELKGDLKIVDIEGEYLYVAYKDFPPKKIFQSNLKRGRITNILNNIDKRHKEFHYNIGERIIDENKNLTIINLKIDNGKYILIKCNKCNYQFWEKEKYLKNKNYGCKCCSGRIVVKGINDLATTHPHLIRYLKNSNDGFLYSKGMNNKIIVKCPDCGFEKLSSINNLSSNKFKCNNCSDGFSFPNKLMSNILLYLNEDFIPEFMPEWSNGRYYDFYLPNRNIIIEMDGALGHGNGIHKYSKITLEESINIDKFKDTVAKENNIDVIRIDCISSEFESIYKNLINEEKISFLRIKDITDKEWNRILDNSYNSLVKIICNYYIEKNNCSPYIISKKFKLNVSTIRKYLKIGTKLNWCQYNPIRGKHS